MPAAVVSRTPNGGETSTFATFNSLANAVAACVARDSACLDLFNAGRPPGGAAPDNVLQAVANIVKYPSYPGYPNDQQDPVFQLSRAAPVYQPALTQRPTSWLLFLKITGGFYSAQDSNNLMNGPGNFAIDELGYVYFDTNYFPRPPGEFACASNRAVKLTPWGENAPNSPFLDGGLSGQGFGVIFDPSGRLWIANFGFQDPPCEFTPQKATQNSVSVFTRDGTAISPPQGYTQGNISWPQGISSDRQGNIWIASCGNDTVTLYRQGDPSQATNIPLGPTPPSGEPQIKPFGTVVDAQGNLWVTGNRSNAMYVLSPSGALIATLPGTYQGKTVITKPIGNTIDSKGNVWVANSDWLDSPCPTRRDPRQRAESVGDDVPRERPHAAAGVAVYRRRDHAAVGRDGRRRRHGVGPQLRCNAAGAEQQPIAHHGRQPPVRRRHDEVPAGPRHRRSDIAVDGLSKQRAAADDGRRGRSFRQLVGHEQLEDRCRSVPESRRQRRRDSDRRRRPAEDTGDRSAGAVPMTGVEQSSVRSRSASATASSSCGDSRGRPVASGQAPPPDAGPPDAARVARPSSRVAEPAALLRHVAGGTPNSRLNARLKAASDS